MSSVLITDNSAKQTKGFVKSLLREFGPAKSQSNVPDSRQQPKYFLLRKFHDVVDLAIIFQTRRCPYNCAFCAIPSLSLREDVTAQDIVDQFHFTAETVAHGLHLADRISLGNDNSVLDETTFPREALNPPYSSTRQYKGWRAP